MMMACFVESFWVGKCCGPVPPCRELDRKGTPRFSAVQSSRRTFCRSNLDSYVTLGTRLGPCRGECGGGMGVSVLSAVLCLLCLPRLASPRPGCAVGEVSCPVQCSDPLERNDGGEGLLVQGMCRYEEDSIR